MFSVEIADGEILKCVAKALDQIAKYVECEVSPDVGITFQGWDIARNGFILVTFRKENLKSFECSARDLFGFHMQLLNEILKVPTSYDNVYISANDENRAMFRFSMASKKKLKGSQESFSAALYLNRMQIEDQELVPIDHVAGMENVASIEMDAEHFANITGYIDNLDPSGNSIQISFSGHKFVTFASCSGMARANFRIEEDKKNADNSKVHIVMNEPVSQVFPLRQLAKVANVCRVASKVRISIGGSTEGERGLLLPMLVEWKLSLESSLRYYLSQMLDED